MFVYIAEFSESQENPTMAFFLLACTCFYEFLLIGNFSLLEQYSYALKQSFGLLNSGRITSDTQHNLEEV